MTGGLRWPVAARAGVIYGGGDTFANALTGHFELPRVAGITLLGMLTYGPDNHRYFIWLDRRLPDPSTGLQGWGRAVLAIAWFNPLWIARHDLFLIGLSRRFTAEPPNLLLLGLRTFVLIPPISLVANHSIQNRVPLDHRMLASAAFSAMMAVFHALVEVWLGRG